MFIYLIFVSHSSSKELRETYMEPPFYSDTTTMRQVRLREK